VLIFMICSHTPGDFLKELATEIANVYAKDAIHEGTEVINFFIYPRTTNPAYCLRNL